MTEFLSAALGGFLGASAGSVSTLLAIRWHERRRAERNMRQFSAAMLGLIGQAQMARGDERPRAQA